LLTNQTALKININRRTCFAAKHEYEDCCVISSSCGHKFLHLFE